MGTKIYELDDNRYLGINIFEITSFPSISTFSKNDNESCEKNTKEFMRMVTELHQLCGSDVCVEFLWLAEDAEFQTFSSRIRIFGILRKIGTDSARVTYELDSLQNNVLVSLTALQYNVVKLELHDLDFQNVLVKVKNDCVYGIVKKEKCLSNANSLYPYYFSDVVPNRNFNNFNSIIAAMSQHKNCGISFQLFPVRWEPEELYWINEASAELSGIATGTLAQMQMYKDPLATEPFKVYSYYNERRNAPMFLYNILTFGEREVCASLASRITSLLQSGEEKIVTADFGCFDLSNEGICLSRDIPHYAWNVNNKLIYHYRNHQLQSMVPLAQKMFRLPYLMSAEEVVSFFKLPLHEKTMSALKNNQIAYSQEQFSHSVVNKDNIQFGVLVSSEANQIVIGASEKSFTKHALVVGTPGSGKTTFSVNILLQFAKKGIPFLAIEPTKAEYRAMIDALPDLRIFTPGNNAVSPYIINPFIPPKGIRIEQYIPSLASAFKAAFSMPSPLDMIFLKAVRNCYIQYGWKDYSMYGDEDVKLFGLHEFILVFKQLLEKTNYSKEVRGNLESAGLLRLTNLIEQNSNIYDTVNTVPIEDLLTAPTVIELNSIDNAEQKSLIMALLLINICVYTKHNHEGDGELKNVILIDEAHVLLGGGSSNLGENSPDSQSATIKALQDMIAEIRSYGTSIIIADQSPTKVSREVVANTDIKVAFRLVQSIEKELIADSTNMDDEAKNNLSRLKPGEAYVYYSKLETPQMIMTEDIREKERIRLSVSDSEVASKSTYWDNRQELLKPYSECLYCDSCKAGCDFKVRSNAEYIANSAFEKYRSKIQNSEVYKSCIFHMPRLMAKEFEKYTELDVLRLQQCSRIKLLRKMELELPVSMTDAEKINVITTFPKESE